MTRTREKKDMARVERMCRRVSVRYSGRHTRWIERAEMIRWLAYCAALREGRQPEQTRET